MDVSVHFFGFQRAVTRAESIKVPLMADMCAGDVLTYIADRYPHLALQGADLFVTVNNTVCEKDKILESNDAISFFPHIGGG